MLLGDLHHSEILTQSKSSESSGSEHIFAKQGFELRALWIVLPCSGNLKMHFYIINSIVFKDFIRGILYFGRK